MLDRKSKIINAALELFAIEGYNAVPTSKIAKVAGVSEGLIFRHFDNKKSLLDAIMEQAENRLMEAIGPILSTQDPKEVIRKTLSLPFSIDQSEYDFWRLQYKLKWEPEYFHPEKMQKLTDKLFSAFSSLGNQNPEQETKLVIQLLDSIAIELLRGELKDTIAYKEFLLKKYQLL